MSTSIGSNDGRTGTKNNAASSGDNIVAHFIRPRMAEGHDR